MKKKLALALAVLMLALAGCGSKVSRVTDYEIDIPEGFEEADPAEAGVTACWFRNDGSNINMNVSDRDSAAELGFKAVNADLMRTTISEQMEQAYGVAPDISDRYFTKDEVSGLPAYQYCYDLELNGISMSQLVVCVNADPVYTFTFTTANEDTMALFEDCAGSIRLIVE